VLVGDGSPHETHIRLGGRSYGARGALNPRLITDGSELPVLAFTLADDVTNYSVFDVSAGLREEGWLVPAYTFPPDLTELAVLRIVVRNGMSHDLADLLTRLEPVAVGLGCADELRSVEEITRTGASYQRQRAVSERTVGDLVAVVDSVVRELDLG